MKRILLTAVMTSGLALAAPAIASAHHGNAHQHARHANTRAHHHAVRARVINFGAPITPGGSGAGGATTGTGPTEPTPPTPPSGETAGTVTSFTNGVLTITLTGGSVVSGQVTEKTEIHCQPATPASGGEDQGDGPDSEASGGPSSQDQQDGQSQDGQQGNEGQDSQDGESGSGDGQQQGCTSAALVPGTVVREAELSVTGAGAVWDHVDLIQ